MKATKSGLLNSRVNSRVRVSLSDEEDLFSVKHVAASRFHRNQKLMADIFSDVVVPDLRTG